MGVDSTAYWFKNGKIIKIQGEHHIKDIISNPTTFGFTKKYVEDTYKEFNENIGLEGKARAKLMCEAMDKGWIRIRRAVSKEGPVWTLQFDNYNRRKKDLQNAVSYLLLESKEMKKSDILQLLSYDGKTDERYDPFYGKKIESFFLEEKKEKIELIDKYSFFNY